VCVTGTDSCPGMFTVSTISALLALNDTILCRAQLCEKRKESQDVHRLDGEIGQTVLKLYVSKFKIRMFYIFSFICKGFGVFGI
jgi:hypothetical protein